MYLHNKCFIGVRYRSKNFRQSFLQSIYKRLNCYLNKNPYEYCLAQHTKGVVIPISILIVIFNQGINKK